MARERRHPSWKELEQMAFIFFGSFSGEPFAYLCTCYSYSYRHFGADLTEAIPRHHICGSRIPDYTRQKRRP